MVSLWVKQGLWEGEAPLPRARPVLAVGLGRRGGPEALGPGL